MHTNSISNSVILRNQRHACARFTVDFTPVRISVSGVERSWRGACVYGDMNMYISSTCARVWSRVRLGLERFLCLLRLMRFELNG